MLAMSSYIADIATNLQPVTVVMQAINKIHHGSYQSNFSLGSPQFIGNIFWFNKYAYLFMCNPDSPGVNRNEYA